QNQLEEELHKKYSQIINNLNEEIAKLKQDFKNSEEEKSQLMDKFFEMEQLCNEKDNENKKLMMKMLNSKIEEEEMNWNEKQKEEEEKSAQELEKMEHKALIQQFEKTKNLLEERNKELEQYKTEVEELRSFIQKMQINSDLQMETQKLQEIMETQKDPSIQENLMDEQTVSAKTKTATQTEEPMDQDLTSKEKASPKKVIMTNNIIQMNEIAIQTER